MKKIATLALNQAIVRPIILTALLFLVPALVHNQAITGPIVNAGLLLSLFYLGKSQAFFLAMLPSTVALSRGLLPLALAPMLPFIMLSNVIYVASFSFLESKVKATSALIVASMVKMLFLTLTVKLLMGGLLATPLLAKVEVMMTWPQLWTALVGGWGALVIRKHVKI